jgi:hypothetical protein
LKNPRIELFLGWFIRGEGRLKGRRSERCEVEVWVGVGVVKRKSACCQRLSSSSTNRPGKQGSAAAGKPAKPKRR